MRESFDPHLHRDIEYPISNVDAFISIMKCSIGTGCLEMPRAFCNAGWLNGLVGTFVIGFIMVYSINILIIAMYEICKVRGVPLLSYPECMRIALEEGPLCLLNFFMSLYHFGVCCVYILFIADNLKQLGDAFYRQWSYDLYVISLTGPLVSIFMMRSLKSLVPFSMLANVMVITDLPPLSDRKMFNTIRKYPLFFGTVLFSMESVGVIIAIENEMTNPKDFLGPTGILSLASLFTLMLYAGFGFVGYWRFGCQAYGSITLNMPSDMLISQMAKLLLASAIFLTYALQGYVIVNVLWHYYLEDMFDEKYRTILEYNTRCAIVLSTVGSWQRVAVWSICLEVNAPATEDDDEDEDEFGRLIMVKILVAVFSPDISIFLPLVGAFCLSILSFVFPGLMDLCVSCAKGHRLTSRKLLRDIFLIIVGITGCIAGTWEATLSIKRDYGYVNEGNQRIRKQQQQQQQQQRQQSTIISTPTLVALL
uniref:Amino acid transporter transmembrane domain-containing protein n=1 Tax=Glossina brevipalpis TaxID=37001 RepID=A0A1A9W4P5_9MUSC